MVRQEEMVALAQALQMCAVQSRTPQGMLCRAVHELYRYLAPLLRNGDLLDLTLLDVVEEEPVTPPVPTETASSPDRKTEPRKEEPIDLPAPNEEPASEPEEAVHSEELALVWRRMPPAPLGLPVCGWTSLAHPLRGSRLTG